jgi:hypothetical protein
MDGGENGTWPVVPVQVRMQSGPGSRCGAVMETDKGSTMGAGTTSKELIHIDPRDLHELLATQPDRLLGRIIELNRHDRYRNTLDAIGIFQRLIELRHASAERSKEK